MNDKPVLGSKIQTVWKLFKLTVTKEEILIFDLFWLDIPKLRLD